VTPEQAEARARWVILGDGPVAARRTAREAVSSVERGAAAVVQKLHAAALDDAFALQAANDVLGLRDDVGRANGNKSLHERRAQQLREEARALVDTMHDDLGFACRRLRFAGLVEQAQEIHAWNETTPLGRRMKLGSAGDADRNKRAQQDADDAELAARGARLVEDSERSMTVSDDARRTAEEEVARFTGRPVALTIAIFDRGADPGGVAEVYRDGALYGRHPSGESARHFVRQMGWGEVPVIHQPRVPKGGGARDQPRPGG
jgi:hypothetical protein